MASLADRILSRIKPGGPPGTGGGGVSLPVPTTGGGSGASSGGLTGAAVVSSIRQALNYFGLETAVKYQNRGQVFLDPRLTGETALLINTLFPNIGGSGKTKRTKAAARAIVGADPVLRQVLRFRLRPRALGGGSWIGGVRLAEQLAESDPLLAIALADRLRNFDVTPSLRSVVLQWALGFRSVVPTRVEASLIPFLAALDRARIPRPAPSPRPTLPGQTPGENTGGSMYIDTSSVLGQFAGGMGGALKLGSSPVALPGGSGSDPLSSLISTIPGIISAIKGPAAVAGGVAGAALLPQVLGGTGVTDLPFVDVTPQGTSGLFEPFTRPGTTGGRPKLHMQVNDAGKPYWFRPAGRPVLWSTDLRACKTVERVARLAKRASRRRSGGR